jgi:hypothetical protein
MDVHVSTMTGKLEGFRAINSNTRTNPFCLAMYENAADNVICRSCYSHEMLKAYRANTVPALQRNSDALSKRGIRAIQCGLLAKAAKHSSRENMCGFPGMAR